MQENQSDLIIPYYQGDINEGLSIPDGFQNRSLNTEPIDYLYEDYNTDLLVVTFAGSGLNLGKESNTAFEWNGFFSDKNISRIAVRDDFTAWYFNGIRGVSTNITTTAIFLSGLIKTSKAKKVLFLGVSAGGFAAILFGILLKVDKIFAINPQTLLQKGIQCMAHGNLYKLKWCDPNEAMYYDLLVLPYPDKNTLVQIVYGKDELTDRFHSGRMGAWAHLENVKILAREGSHGTLAVALRDNGSLGELFFL